MRWPRSRIRLVLFVLITGLVVTVLRANDISHAYTYPRKALRTAWINKWFTILDSAAYISEFDLVYTTSSASSVLVVVDSLEADNLAVPDFVYTLMPMLGGRIDCDDCLDSQYPGYLTDYYYDWAKESWRDLARVAVYHNKQESVEWELLDTEGDPMHLWNCVLLNYSPWCPVGAWDGVVRKGNKSWDFGSTEGLTVTEWLCTVALDSLFLENANFAEAFVGIHTEDGIYRHLPSLATTKADGSASTDPDPKADSTGLDPDDWHQCWTTFADSTKASVDSVFTHFLQSLIDEDYRTLATGARPRYLLEPNSSCADDSLYVESYLGAKLEDFGRWGSFPGEDLELLPRVVYEPLGGDLLDPIHELHSLDHLGQEFVSVELLPSLLCTAA